MRKVGVIAALAVVAGLFWALAEPEPPVISSPFEVSQMAARTDLARAVDELEDPRGSATLADVRGKLAANFRRNDSREIGHGFSASAFWVRFEVRNASADAVRWFLEIEEPTLDDVRLYVVDDEGRVESRITGDARPFAMRDVASGDFVFDLELERFRACSVYVRVATTGALRIPLRAWQPTAWSHAHERVLIAFWFFLGALSAMSLYYATVYLITKQKKYLWCGIVLGAMLMIQASLDGSSAAYFFPAHPRVGNRVLPASIALAMVAITCFVRESLREVEGYDARVVRIIGRAVKCALFALLFALVAPMRAGVELLCATILIVCALAPVLLRAIDLERYPERRLYVLCWSALVITVPLTILRYFGTLPPHPLFDLALRAGILSNAAIMAVLLAFWMTDMRRKLSSMNAELSDHVHGLKNALEEAKEANVRAERAMMAKDDFVATMSHELRTPLNAIINIPQGMISDFDRVRSARCSSCGAEYILEAEERLDAATACEECQSRGMLLEETKVVFHGDPARCLRYLEKIERSGHHLLQMVNGVLDYSKMEAGRFELMLEPTDLAALGREVVEQMSDLGAARGIQLVFTCLSTPPEATVDPLRIKQVLINLVSNAVKFSEANSVVGVELRRDADAAVIEVQDAGIGIAKENHERIFVGFEQVHKGDTRKYGGTGLGLSISRSLVRMHGGELSVRSEIGRGATFVVRLPRLPHPSTHLSVVEASPRPDEVANDAMGERKRSG